MKKSIYREQRTSSGQWAQIKAMEALQAVKIRCETVDPSKTYPNK
jgi:hypothetical protein